jgi:hypothetical protein
MNPERGGPGRGVQLAEAWLMKVPHKADKEAGKDE